MSAPITDMFVAYQTHLDEDQEVRDEIRDIVKVIDVKLREITTLLQVIHKEGGASHIQEACDKGKALLGDVKDGYAKLAAKVQSLSYHR